VVILVTLTTYCLKQQIACKNKFVSHLYLYHAILRLFLILVLLYDIRAVQFNILNTMIGIKKAIKTSIG
jgi:hypothetical protein